MIKAAAEKAGKLDAKAIAEALHGLTITPDKVPGILIEATWDDTGEIDRICFLAEVKDGKQVITQTLPKLKQVSSDRSLGVLPARANAGPQASRGWIAAGRRASLRLPGHSSSAAP